MRLKKAKICPHCGRSFFNRKSLREHLHGFHTHADTPTLRKLPVETPEQRVLRLVNRAENRKAFRDKTSKKAIPKGVAARKKKNAMHVAREEGRKKLRHMKIAGQHVLVKKRTEVMINGVRSFVDA